MCICATCTCLCIVQVIHSKQIPKQVSKEASDANHHIKVLRGSN